MISFVRRRRMHAVNMGLKKIGGEWVFSGLIWGFTFIGILRPEVRIRKVRRERR